MEIELIENSTLRVIDRFNDRIVCPVYSVKLLTDMIITCRLLCRLYDLCGINGLCLVVMKRTCITLTVYMSGIYIASLEILDNLACAIY